MRQFRLCSPVDRFLEDFERKIGSSHRRNVACVIMTVFDPGRERITNYGRMLSHVGLRPRSDGTRALMGGMQDEPERASRLRAILIALFSRIW